MFVTRLISGIVMLAIVILTGFLGGPVFFALIAVLSLIGLFEFLRMLKLQKSILSWVSFIWFGVTMSLLFFEKFQAVDAVCLFVILVYLSVFVVQYPKIDVKQVFSVYFSYMYTVLLFSYLFRIRCMENGMLLLWFVFICTWGSDTCAYCAGRLFGKHKAFPVLSPKKTIEGCIGGAVGTSIIAAVYALCVNALFTDVSVNVLMFLILSFIASAISQMGDLAASAIKRSFSIKDYGKLIPGHGGVIDRFDSVLFTAPLIFYAVTFFAG